MVVSYVARGIGEPNVSMYLEGNVSIHLSTVWFGWER